MLSFTKQEQAIVLFLIFALITGSVVTLYQRFWRSEALPEVSAGFADEFTKRAEEINREVSGQPAAPVANPTVVSGIELRKGETAAVRESATATDNQNSSSYFLVNVNAATLEELQTIPRVGPVLAQKILDYRLQNGGFKSIEELTRVKGIGKATFEKIRPHVSIK